MHFKPKFNPSEVVQSFQLEQLLIAQDFQKKGADDNLCAFLENINPGSYHLGQEQQTILNTWSVWFSKKGCPWAVTQRNGNFRLWKIDETLSQEEIKKERKKDGVRWFAETDQGEPALRALEGVDKVEIPKEEAPGICICRGCEDEDYCGGLCKACYSRKHKWERQGKVFDYVRKPRQPWGQNRVDKLNFELGRLG